MYFYAPGWFALLATDPHRCSRSCTTAAQRRPPFSSLNHPIIHPIIQSQSSNHPSMHVASSLVVLLPPRSSRIVHSWSARTMRVRGPFESFASARPDRARRILDGGSPVVAPAPPFFSAPRRRTNPSAASRIASRSRGRRAVRAAAGRARCVVDIEGRPDDPRRRVAAEKNGRHPRHGWRAHDRSFAPSRRRRPKDGASAAANARVRERRRSGSSDDPEARKKSRRPRARRLPRSKRFRPRVVRRGTGGARERARRAPRSAGASCRWAAAPRAHFSEAHIAPPAHGTGPSQRGASARRHPIQRRGVLPRMLPEEPRAKVRKVERWNAVAGGVYRTPRAGSAPPHAAAERIVRRRKRA